MSKINGLKQRILNSQKNDDSHKLFIEKSKLDNQLDSETNSFNDKLDEANYINSKLIINQNLINKQIDETNKDLIKLQNENLKLRDLVLNSNNELSQVKNDLIKLRDENLKLRDLVLNSNNELSQLKEDYSNFQMRTEEIFDANENFFNYLFIFNDYKPKGMLKKIQDLSQELLDFVNNICIRYDLDYWLYSGTLLGAIRHNGFIPWDDDLDIAMMRADSLKFNEIIDFEIEQNNLVGILQASKERHPRTGVVAFTQLQIPSKVFRYMTLAHLDIFPFDYVKNPPENIEELFKKAKREYHNNLNNDMDKLDVIKDYYQKLNLSFEEQEFILPCIESEWGDSVKFKLFEFNKIFPLQKIEFEGNYYPCPSDYNDNLIKVYGDNFRFIPKNAKTHNVIKTLITEEEKINPLFDEATNRLKEANNNFN